MKGWILWAIGVVFFLFLVARLGHAQTMPPPAAYYEIGVFRSTDAKGPTSPAFTVTRVTLEMLSCGHLKSDEPPPDVPNPTRFTWFDPADESKECWVMAPTIALSLPLGVGYRAAVRAVAATGTSSFWTFTAQTFRRAPRGLPCAGGTGVELSVGVDIQGKPMQVTLCVQGTP